MKKGLSEHGGPILKDEHDSMTQWNYSMVDIRGHINWIHEFCAGGEKAFTRVPRCTKNTGAWGWRLWRHQIGISVLDELYFHHTSFPFTLSALKQTSEKHLEGSCVPEWYTDYVGRLIISRNSLAELKTHHHGLLRQERRGYQNCQSSMEVEAGPRRRRKGTSRKKERRSCNKQVWLKTHASMKMFSWKPLLGTMNTRIKNSNAFSHQNRGTPEKLAVQGASKRYNC